MKTDDQKRIVTRAVQSLTNQAKTISDSIATLAERPFKEFESVKLLTAFLESHGFEITYPFKAIPTAFRAVAGSGGKTVGILGEYDALPDCGPEPGSWGHGCGHNLLGVGSAVAAVAAARILKNSHQEGRIVYYGCPAEEPLAGKAYMARDGGFRDLDACIVWHPGSETLARFYGGSAVDSVEYEFFGRTAHAAYPVGGKSALDAAILFDVAVNYLRERIPDNVRIHSVIKDGGDVPNVVPAYARSWYYIRALNRKQVDEIRQLVDDCARGAAIATQTRFKTLRTTAVYDRLPNSAMCRLLEEKLALFGTVRATAGDVAAAKELGLSGEFCRSVVETDMSGPSKASSDEATVSWLAPMGRFNMATQAIGTPSHHRILAAQMTLPFAHRGMLQASKVGAAAALELLTNHELMAEVQREFGERRGKEPFDSLLPKRQKVPTF